MQTDLFATGIPPGGSGYPRRVASSGYAQTWQFFKPANSTSTTVSFGLSGGTSLTQNPWGATFSFF
jgi:hypothetical protein